MSKEKQNRVKRINLEVKRLTEVFDKLPADKRKTSLGLINRAGFLLVSLEDYEDDINTNGSVDLFQQSEAVPAYERARPVVQQYNSANKLYQTIIKQLADMLPDRSEATSLQTLLNDINSKPV